MKRRDLLKLFSLLFLLAISGCVVAKIPSPGDIGSPPSWAKPDYTILERQDGQNILYSISLILLIWSSKINEDFYHYYNKVYSLKISNVLKSASVVDKVEITPEGWYGPDEDGWYWLNSESGYVKLRYFPAVYGVELLLHDSTSNDLEIYMKFDKDLIQYYDEAVPLHGKIKNISGNIAYSLYIDKLNLVSVQNDKIFEGEFWYYYNDLYYNYSRLILYVKANIYDEGSSNPRVILEGYKDNDENPSTYGMTYFYNDVCLF